MAYTAPLTLEVVIDWTAGEIITRTPRGYVTDRTPIPPEMRRVWEGAQRAWIRDLIHRRCAGNRRRQERTRGRH